MQKSWINKIIEHHITPPEAAWDNIASELDKEDKHLDGIKLKLLTYETAAPGIVFKNVFDQLDKEAGKLHPIKKNKQTRAIFIRMAVAASVITIVLLLFLNNKKITENKEAVTSTETSQPAIKQPGTKADTNLPIPATNKKKDEQEIAGMPVKKTNTQQTAVLYAYNKSSIVEELKLQNMNNPKRQQNMQQIMPVSISLINALNPYITITGPGGERVKLSSKFGSALGIVNDGSIGMAENIDAIIKENSKWSNLFAGWRDKMAGHLIAPSLINFLDIVELSEFLEEKKQPISWLDLNYLNLY